MNARAEDRVRAYLACPQVDRVGERQHQAVVDALDLVESVRELDPREVWGTLVLWGQADPLRLYALVTALAAMVPAGVPVAELLAWTESFVQKGAA